MLLRHPGQKIEFGFGTLADGLVPDIAVISITIDIVPSPFPPGTLHVEIIAVPLLPPALVGCCVCKIPILFCRVDHPPLVFLHQPLPLPKLDPILPHGQHRRRRLNSHRANVSSTSAVEFSTATDCSGACPKR